MCNQENFYKISYHIFILQFFYTCQTYYYKGMLLENFLLNIHSFYRFLTVNNQIKQIIVYSHQSHIQPSYYQYLCFINEFLNLLKFFCFSLIVSILLLIYNIKDYHDIFFINLLQYYKVLFYQTNMMDYIKMVNKFLIKAFFRYIYDLIKKSYNLHLYSTQK